MTYMQWHYFLGKFQMQVLPQCGHSVHEDVPEKVCFILVVQWILIMLT